MLLGRLRDLRHVEHGAFELRVFSSTAAAKWPRPPPTSRILVAAPKS
jgi:hypothetical protein